MGSFAAVTKVLHTFTLSSLLRSAVSKGPVTDLKRSPDADHWHEWRFHFDALFAKAQGDSTGSHFSPAFMLDGLHWKIWLKFPTDMKYNSDSVLAAYLYCTNEEFDEANYAISVQMRHPSEPSDSINRGGACLFQNQFIYNSITFTGLVALLVTLRWILAGLSASVPGLRCGFDPERMLDEELCSWHFLNFVAYAWCMQTVHVTWQRWAWGIWGVLASGPPTVDRNYFLITKRGAMFASYLLLHRGVYLWFNMAGYQDMLSWLLALVVAVAALKDCLGFVGPIVESTAWLCHFGRMGVHLCMAGVTAATTSSAVEEYADPMSQLELQLDIDTLLPCIMDVFLALTFFTSWKHAVLDTVFLPTRNWDTRMKLEHLDKHRQLRLHWHGHMFKRAAPSFCVALSGAAAWLTLRLLALLGSAHAKAVLSEQSAQADQGRHESWSWRSVMSLVVRTAKFWSWALFIHMTAPVWDPLSHLGRCLSSSSLQFRHAYLRARQPSSAPRRARTAHRQQARRPHAGLQQWTAQSWQAVVEGVYTACTAAMTLLWTAILWPFKQHRASSASNAAAHRSQPGITAKTSGQPSSRQQRRGGSKAKAKARPKPSQKADNAVGGLSDPSRPAKLMSKPEEEAERCVCSDPSNDIHGRIQPGSFVGYGLVRDEQGLPIAVEPIGKVRRAISGQQAPASSHAAALQQGHVQNANAAGDSWLTPDDAHAPAKKLMTAVPGSSSSQDASTMAKQRMLASTDVSPLDTEPALMSPTAIPASAHLRASTATQQISFSKRG
ncbi:hypothetical protein WJX74_007502 [Apatococcus lobatus]|uniref:MATH domain-containing protein n=1 Tax=Apatococcus lobatus TaxID=904363 RepID=A0AAW1REX0_9CHLO